MIKGAPRAIMIAFFVVGVAFLGFSGWALNTEIPREQFQEDPRFEEEYVKYYQWFMAFGGGLIGSGITLGILGRKMYLKNLPTWKIKTENIIYIFDLIFI